MIFREGKGDSAGLPRGQMHLKRLVIALILVPLLFLYVMYLPPEYFLFLLTFFSTLGMAEFYAMSRINAALKYAAIACGAAIMFVFFMAKGFFVHVLVLSVLVLAGLRLVIQRNPGAAVADVSAAAFGLLYIPGLLVFQLDLVKAGPQWIVLLYASVWAADSMAFYVGTHLGRRKLYPEISPNKTVEGAAGSVVGGIFGAALIKTVIHQELSFGHMIIAGAVIGIATVVGDLVESMFKRDAGIKDSGSIVPGHGGVLDKMDGVTFAGPAFYFLCLALGLI